MPVSEDNINPHLTKPVRIVVLLLYGVLGAPDIRHHMLPVRRCLGACNAVFFSVLDVIRDLRRLQKCLGRHTSGPEAVATNAVLFHECGLFTQFCTRHGKHESRTSTADNYYLICIHDSPPPRCTAYRRWRRTLPGNCPVTSPSSTTVTPLTNTQFTPTGDCTGSDQVDLSATVSGSKTTISAASP